MNLYQLSIPGNQYESFTYSAGETQVRFSKAEIKKIENATEVHVTARITDAQGVITLCLLSDALLKIAGLDKRMILILPYLPYSRADRRFLEGDCFGLRTFGNIIDGLGYHKVVTVDVHSKEARKYISNLYDIKPTPLIPANFAVDSDSIILFPDKGAADRYSNTFSRRLYCEKLRNPVTGKLSGFKVDPRVQNYKNVLIIDDICDGGGTFNGIANELQVLGISPANTYLWVTHGIFSKGFDELSVNFKAIYTTDSFTSPTPGFVTRTPIDGLVLDHLISREDQWKLAATAS
jgi:ribose-phosphate pyrophosphokinase